MVVALWVVEQASRGIVTASGGAQRAACVAWARACGGTPCARVAQTSISPRASTYHICTSWNPRHSLNPNTRVQDYLLLLSETHSLAFRSQ